MNIDTSDTRFQVLVAGTAVFVVLIGVLLFSGGSSGGEAEVVFQNESAGLTGYDDGSTEISLDQATDEEADGSLSSITLSSSNNAMQTALEMAGAYNGNTFRDVYSEDDEPVIQISKRITPKDGIAEGYFVPEFTTRDGNEVVKVTVYLDDDFLDLVPEPTIVYGWDWDNEAAFNRVEVREGLYSDSVIIDDAERMRSDQRSEIGVTVGEVPEFGEFRIDPSDKTLFILS